MSLKRIIYRIVFLGFTILIIPLLPILIIFLGISSPEYVIYGTLNLDVSQSVSSWEIYTTFLKHILMFDFGTSTSSGQLVIHEVVKALRESLKSIIIALLLSYTIGTAAGIFSAKSYRLRKLWDRMEFIFYIPMIVFSYLVLYLLDFTGIDFLSNIRYVFAGLILSIYPFYIVSKSMNKTIAEVKNSDFFSFHKSCGFEESQIWKKFCKRFVIVDYLSFFENLLIFMFGFIFFVETPFGIHGMGYRFVLAIQRFDYPVIIGFCIFSIILFSIIGILVETIKMRVDPRVSYE